MNKVRIVVNPESDSAFQRVTERLFVEHSDAPSDLEEGLREPYPEARVVPGITDSDNSERWYVYRDGYWVDAGKRPRPPRS